MLNFMTNEQITNFNNSGYAYSPVGVVYQSGVYVAKYYVVPNEDETNSLVIVDCDNIYYSHDINMSVKDSLNALFCTEQIGYTWVPSDLRSYSVFGDGKYTYSLVFDYPFLTSTWEDVRRDLFTAEFNIVDLRTMSLEQDEIAYKMHNNGNRQNTSHIHNTIHKQDTGNEHVFFDEDNNNYDADSEEMMNSSDGQNNDDQNSDCSCGLNLSDKDMEDSIVIINNKPNKGGELTYIFNLEDYLALKVLCPDLDLSNLEESIENYNTPNPAHNNNRKAHNNNRKNKITQTIQLRRSERIKKMNLRRSNRLAHKAKTCA
jgi:hypothetical protein